MSEYHEENGGGQRSHAEMPEYLRETRDAVLDIALPNVAFDGWSEAMLREAVEQAEVDPALAKLAFPRGVVDLAAEAHRRDDARLAERMAEAGEHLRMREKIAKAVQVRLELAGEYEEAVRRAAALFALPQNAAEGARLTWGTADAIWNAVGDTSTDYNWYTKRMTLSGVYSATLLYWFGDASLDKEATWRFLDRRIDDVMRIEKAKAMVRNNPLAKLALAGPRAILSKVRAPGVQDKPEGVPVGFPGRG
jgi:ubiquinone biosynthesis protein COQ9